jgi:hypothetical protein
MAKLGESNKVPKTGIFFRSRQNAVQPSPKSAVIGEAAPGSRIMAVGK